MWMIIEAIGIIGNRGIGSFPLDFISLKAVQQNPSLGDDYLKNDPIPYQYNRGSSDKICQ